MVCGSHNDTVVTTTRRSRTVVDLLRAYSKRPDLSFELVSAVERLQVEDGRTVDTGRSVRSEQAPRVWRICDRLSEADIRSLVSSYRAGTTARELAERFKISKSSVKQILRERGIRRTSLLRNGLTHTPAVSLPGAQS
jgi:DNA-directed RNA polymerase specialized sigma24 family protein